MTTLSFFFVSEKSLMSMKQKFEAEIEEWRTKLGDAQNTIAQLKIEISNKQQENKTLTSKYDMFEGEEVLLIGHKRLVPFRKTISPFLLTLEGFIYYLQGQ